MKQTAVHISPVLERIARARNEIPRLLMVIGEDKSASWQYRVAWPCNALSSRGFVADWCLGRDLPNFGDMLNAGRYNVVLTPRAHWDSIEEADNFIATVRDAGLAWVYELDDDGWSPGVVERQSRLFNSEWGKGEERLEWERQEHIRLINKADGVIVSSEHLAEVARSFTPRPVFCVPNFLDTAWFTGRQEGSIRVVPPITVGWSGGTRDENDLTAVGAAWTSIARMYPTVRFVTHGAMPGVLTKAVPADRLTPLIWSSLPDYPRALMNLDIACCSVAPGVNFNLSKTPIKWMETTMSGSACVVSKTLYGPEVRDGKDALVAETADEWTEALSRLIEDGHLRNRLRKNARRTVETKHALNVGWPCWVEALHGAISFRQEQATHDVE